LSRIFFFIGQSLLTYLFTRLLVTALIVALVVGVLIIAFNVDDRTYGRRFTWVAALTVAVGFILHAWTISGDPQSDYTIAMVSIIVAAYERREWKRRQEGASPLTLERA